ncbi:hypothetical protein SH449x_000891 [Pirellulaceae bacterium SH449]
MARCIVGISLWNPVPQFCHRGRPFGDDEWTEEMAEKHGVWFTLRPIGRPIKKKKPTPP